MKSRKSEISRGRQQYTEMAGIDEMTLILKTTGVDGMPDDAEANSVLNAEP